MYIEFVRELKSLNSHGRIWLRVDLIERVEPGEKTYPTTLILMANRETYIEVKGDFDMNAGRIRGFSKDRFPTGEWRDAHYHAPEKS